MVFICLFVGICRQICTVADLTRGLGHAETCRPKFCTPLPCHRRGGERGPPATTDGRAWCPCVNHAHLRNAIERIVPPSVCHGSIHHGAASESPEQGNGAGEQEHGQCPERLHTTGQQGCVGSGGLLKRDQHRERRATREK